VGDGHAHGFDLAAPGIAKRIHVLELSPRFSPETKDNRAVPALVALVAVTAVWGVTFVQVKDAVALYPLFAFLAVRFAIATGALAVPALTRVRSLGRKGASGGALLGLLLAAGYVLQTAGLERTTVFSTGFITGMYVVLTPLLALA